MLTIKKTTNNKSTNELIEEETSIKLDEESSIVKLGIKFLDKLIDDAFSGSSDKKESANEN